MGCVQTDNGSEFAGEFEDFLRNKGIIHFYTHPKRPQENGYVERFQRTIQEYFIDVYPLDSTDIEEFNNQRSPKCYGIIQRFAIS
ncbi:transposase family protein [bacterium]|nr:transposase family protein [bacterium]